MSQRFLLSFGAAFFALALAIPTASGQGDPEKKKPDLGKQIDDALKELERGKPNPEVPEANPEPRPDEPRRNPFPRRAPLDPFGGNANIFRDLERIQKQIEAMNRLFENLENPEKQGEAVDELRRQLGDLNRRNGGGRPGDPVELMLKQIDILNKAQNDRNADPTQLLLRQLQLMKEIQGAAQQQGNRPPARLGVMLQEPGEFLAEQLNLPAGKGLVLKEVLPGSVASKAGLVKGDILLEWGGAAVPSDIPEFQRMIAGTKVDEPFDVVLLRRGRKETIRGVLLPVQNAAARPMRQLGLFDLLP